MVGSARHGYAMMVVLSALILFMLVIGVAFRQIGSAVRIESVHTNQIQRDEGSVAALAKALTLLETGAPPTDPYSCQVTIITSYGPRAYKVTYTLEGVNLVTLKHWVITVDVLPTGENPATMPATFSPIH
jgi:hypothetical protein